MSSTTSVTMVPVRLSTVLDLPKPPGMHWRVQATRLVDYEVSVTRNLLSLNNSALAKAVGADGRRRTRCLVVIDSTVHDLYGERLREYFDAWRVEAHWEPVPGDEAAKSLEAAVAVTGAMNRMGILRRTEKVVAIGGGVVLDVAGLAASIYRRGVPYVRVPTTLVGQIDAGIGVKTGVNHGHHKNRLGTYCAPESALIDPEFLRTLPHRHVVNGLAEIIKMALIKDVALFELLESTVADITAEVLARHGSATGEVLFRAISGMLDELEPNLWEDDLERAVDYGHTFSPSLELRADPPLLHGEAVAVDMAICVALARNRGLLSTEDAERAIRLMRDAGLPTSHPVFTADLLDGALGDAIKHRDGLQRVPLTNGIGAAVFVNDLTPDDLAAALEFVAETQGERVPVS
ncbi:sedoheptulose 7-phosphate cyclase [Actinokineospora globicatena]|uniref:2-epi-5-epi-valiolone synthase n=1 Tax=Actinokineospora globicatena TaxID=103729 RepID=A0A9W6QRC6_9PSEU|nr:sedoheptulose 7-phosphate cyclase [Actinokineospora globicatena]GLW93239.1 3-dehydroquinate synthase [Actinokineospora globicatena]